MNSIKYSSITFWFYSFSLSLIIFRKLIPFEYSFVLVTLIYLSSVLWKKANISTLILILLNIFFSIISIIRGVEYRLVLVGTFSIFIYTTIQTLSISHLDKKIYHILKSFLILFILSSFIQFFYSKDLFGLLEANNYTRLESRATPRAVSIFTSSPQSTAYIAGTLLLFSFRNNLVGMSKFLTILLFFSGILTFSKVFIFFVFATILVNISTKTILQSLVGTIALAVSIPFILLNTNFEGLSRLIRIFNTLSNYKNYITYDIWMSQVKLNLNSAYDFLFGKGLGLLSRSNESIVDILGHYSSESYIFQIYNEIGAFGILTLIGVLYFQINKIHRKRLLALMFISLFSPSLYGITISFLIFGMILPLTSLPLSSKSYG